MAHFFILQPSVALRVTFIIKSSQNSWGSMKRVFIVVPYVSIKNTIMPVILLIKIHIFWRLEPLMKAGNRLPAFGVIIVMISLHVPNNSHLMHKWMKGWWYMLPVLCRSLHAVLKVCGVSSIWIHWCQLYRVQGVPLCHG